MAIRLLAISDGVVPTGLARVTQSLLKRLPLAEYEIHHLALNYQGDPHSLPWKVYCCSGRGDPYGYNRVLDLVESIKPHVVFLMNDLWVVAEYLEILSKCSLPTRVAIWVLVESTGMDTDWLERYHRVDRVVACGSFAAEELSKVLGKNKGITIETIPFGVDTSTFHPIAYRDGANAIHDTRSAKLRLGIFSEDEVDDSFLVLNANRNQPRKRIDITLRAFNIFAKDKPKNVRLYLHMGVLDRGWNIVKLAKRFGIEDRLIISTTNPKKDANPCVSDEDMNWIFNACDVGINTSLCEGWGLVSFEHAATGAPQLVPNIPSQRRQWEGAALLVKTKAELIMEGLHWDSFVVDPENIAATLDELYSNRDFRDHWGRLALETARKPEHQWENIASAWDRIFHEMV